LATELGLMGGSGLVIIGLLTIMLAHLIRAGQLQRNSILGLRTPTTMANDSTWVAGHTAAMPLLRWGGLFSILLGISPAVALFILGRATFESKDTLVTVFVELSYLIVIGVLVWAAVVAHRAAGRYLVEHFEDN
jgi:hypothetical protein